MANKQLYRYGPLAILVLLALVIATGAIVGGDDDTGTAEPPDSFGLGAGPGAPEPTGRMPLTYDEARDAGTTTDYDWGDRCDPETGKLETPSVYALPCVPTFTGDNGDSTTGGVSADTIKVVIFQPDPAMDLARAFAGAGVDTSSEALVATYQDYVEILSAQAELSGRRIELVAYPATGRADDVVAAKADAVEIATEIQPFAVIGGPSLDRGTFSQELASHGILSIDPGAPVPQDILDPLAPYVWGTLPSAAQFVRTVTMWAANARESRADGDPDQGYATYAGDPDYHDRPRSVGVLHFEYDPPAWPDEVPEGVELMETYVLDFATLPQKASELMAKFKTAEITSVVFFGDPIAPSYLMSAATALGYHPEWIFTGTTFTDTNLFARGYDPEQMEHAYGVSQQAAPAVQDLQDSIRLYRWYFGDEDALPPSRARYAVVNEQVRLLIAGIHMAGPDLTPQTFARGMFRIPPMGGGPTTPQVSFGNWGFFDGTDYNGIDDTAEIWWDPTVAAPDEAGKDGVGVWRRARGGERFLVAEAIPTPEPFTDVEDTVTVVDVLSADDTPPDYPPPPR